MLTAACVDETVTPLAGGGGAGGGPGGAPTGGAGGSGGEPPSPSVVCEELGRSVLAWSEGPYGSRRGETAAAFELPLLDGSTYRFAESFSGCESYVFIPDTLVVSDTDDTSLWERDLDELVDNSPDNAHYFFVSRAADEGAATESVSAMAGRVEDLLASLPAGDAERWAQRLHVVATRAQDLDGWVSDVLAGHGRAGFLIDPRQKIRGLGFLADVGRYSSILQQQGYWPWRSNLAYAAYDAAYVDAQTKVDARLESEEATVITVWDGEVLEQFAEADVILPSAAEMTAFDTLEIEIESMCPDPDAIEFGNCGAWDYLAVLAVSDDLGQNREIARFITSYHRETRWVVDASAMLPTLAGGGAQHLRWDFAPEWNTQPTATRMELRLSNRGKATRPQEVFPLWTGGPFKRRVQRGAPCDRRAHPVRRDEGDALCAGDRARRGDGELLRVLQPPARDHRRRRDLPPRVPGGRDRGRLHRPAHERHGAEPGRDVVVRPRRLVPWAAGHAVGRGPHGERHAGTDGDALVPRPPRGQRPARRLRRHRAVVVPRHRALTRPARQPAMLSLQSLWQVSPSLELPSSHSSIGDCTTPSPQRSPRSQPAAHSP
jgi:hypothetical protein